MTHNNEENFNDTNSVIDYILQLTIRNVHDT